MKTLILSSPRLLVRRSSSPQPSEESLISVLLFAHTPESKVYRYADFTVHPQNPDLVFAIREDHTNPEPSKVVNTLVVIDAKTTAVTVVVEGNDFYASPKWNHDGSKAAWIEVSFAPPFGNIVDRFAEYNLS